MDATPKLLQIHVDADGSRRRLVLTGELDLMTAENLEAAMTRHCVEGVRELTLDLRNLGFIDSRGLMAILNAKDICAARGAEFFLIPSDEQMHRRLFEIAGLQHLLGLGIDRLGIDP